MTIALLIKPAAMKKKSHRNIIGNLISNGAIVLTGHDYSTIRTQVEDLTKAESDLTVVACGGDGTVNLLLNSVIDLPIRFAVLPMGTGNDFARHIGVRNLEAGLAAIWADFENRVDVGEISFPDGGKKYFLAVSSCGFDAQVNERANQLRGPSGTVKYLAAAFAELSQLKSIKIIGRLDNQDFLGEFTLIAIGNTSSYGGGMKVTPSADIQDGLFAGTLVHSVNRRTFTKVLPKVFWGAHVFHPKVEVMQFREFEIKDTGLPIYADGERMGQTPAKWQIRSGCLRLVTAITN